MYKQIRLILFSLLLSACTLSSESPFSGTVIVAADTATPPPSAPSPTLTPSRTSTAARDRPCGFQWATSPLPELSDRLQTALLQAQLDNITIRAEAFGENCIDENGEIVYFASMETDYYLDVIPSEFAEAELGMWLERIAAVLADFPYQETPGPNPGYLAVTFRTADEQMNIRIARAQLEQAIADGLRGAVLWQHLRSR